MSKTRSTPRRAATTLGLALTALAAAACGRDDARAAETESSGVIVGRENVAVVVTDTIRAGPAISGSLAAEREAILRAEVSGPVVQTYVEDGQRVARGTRLAKIDDTALRDQFLSARSGLTSAQSEYDNAERQAKRSQALSEAGAIAERDLEAAVQARTAAASRLADARARFTNAQELLAKTEIRAPFDGIVSNREVSAGDVVSPGTALVSVVDPSSMRLEASVPADQLSAVQVGSPVEFSVSGYPGRTFTGRITRVNPTADPTTRQVRIIASIPNVGRNLVAGLFAEGRVSAETRLAPIAPLTAVDERGVSPAVMRLRNGKVERVDVQLGLRDPATETVEIISGVVSGDSLLLGAAQGISVGTLVRVSDPTDQQAGAESAAASRQE